jgi:hypothetical protein
LFRQLQKHFDAKEHKEVIRLGQQPAKRNHGATLPEPSRLRQGGVREGRE